MKLKSLNIVKAVASAVVIYAIIFLVASALMFAVTDSNVFGALTLLIGMITTILVTKEYYFKGVKVKNPLTEGMALGIVYVVVSFAIEVPVMVYGFAASMGWSYFSSWNIIVGYLAMLLVPIIVAKKWELEFFNFFFNPHT
jgi:hypothetical protein